MDGWIKYRDIKMHGTGDLVEEISRRLWQLDKIIKVE